MNFSIEKTVCAGERLAVSSSFFTGGWAGNHATAERADFPAALGVARRRIGRYLLTPTYAAYHRWLGRGEELDQMGRNIDHAPDTLMRDLVVMGTADECRAQLDEYFRAGVTTLLYEVLPGFGDLRMTLHALAPGRK